MGALPPREQVLDYLRSFTFRGEAGRSPEDELYISTHVDRLLQTLQLMPALPARARVLELGAGRYPLTLLLQKYNDWDITTADFRADYGESGAGRGEETLTSARYGETRTYRFEMFNAERDQFPYTDGSFDLVLCCEMLEHLIADPSHMLRETHRVLKGGGYVLITTPNHSQLDYAVSLLRGWSISHTLSGYGVYGRHNREYTPREIHQLLQAHNFATTRILVTDVYPRHSLLHRMLTRLGPLRWRRDTILAVAQAHGSHVQLYPEWLYSENWGRRRVTRNWITMGDADIFQLGPGWHGYDSWGEGSRWTGRQAVAYLKPRGQETGLRLRACAGPGGAHGEVRVQGLVAGIYSLPAGDPQELDFPLPEEVRASIAAGALREVGVQIDVADPFVPGSQDPRELGVAVSRIWLE